MADIQNWDSGGNWDSGLQFDVNVFPSAGDIVPYLQLVTSEHSSKPNFIASLVALLQPVADNISTLEQMGLTFDIDDAVGDQLDKVGLWIGRTRYLSVPITGVFFSFDIPGIGFDQGVWLGPFGSPSGVTRLEDDTYRTYLKATIAANQWDGTIPGAYAVWDTIFAGSGTSIFIVDNGDMSIYFGITGNAPDAVTLALITGGYIALKPGGVRIAGYLMSSVPGAQQFGFDSTGPSLGGFDIGAWSQILAPT